MILLLRKKPRKPINQLFKTPHYFTKSLTISTKSINPSSSIESEIERITKLINNHPFPDHPLQPLLLRRIQPSLLSTHLVENVLGRLFSGHSNGLKAFEFFKFSLHHSQSFQPTSDSFEKTLHILTRMRNFDKAFELMNEIRQKYPSLLTLKSMSIFLTKYAKFQSFEDTLKVFDKMEKEIFIDRSFGVDEFNVLLRAFCTERQMKEARSVFGKMYPRFLPNTQTLNILLLGFKESGDITAMELFYHDMIRRGFKPNVVTYNIRIDAYCKKGCFGDGLRIFEEMEKMKCISTLETITTLIYGAGIVRNILRARRLFDEIPQRSLIPDTGAYNALMSSFVRIKDVKSARELMDEMEEKGIEHDNVTYHTMFLGLKKSEGFEGVYNLCKRMIQKRFIPKAYTVVMLMKFFCENRRSDLGLEFWKYLVERGCCPHGHAVDLLVTGLCCQGEVEVAYGCIKEVVERGRYPSEGGFRVMERFLVEAGEIEKLKNLTEMIKRLQSVLALSKGHALGIPSSISL